MKKFQWTALAGAALLAAAGQAALAQDNYPSKTIHIIVPQNAGGSADRTARQIGQHFTDVFKQSAVIENKPGAISMIGSAYVARSAPDGYTLLFNVPSLAIFKASLKNPEIDVEKDLSPISMVANIPLVIAVNSTLPVKNLAEFVAYAKARPGKLNYAGLGGQLTLGFEYFKQAAGIYLVQIPYNGEAQAMPALASNDVQVAFTTTLAANPLIAAGKVKLIGTTAANLRSPGAPDIPSASESGMKNFDFYSWFGMLAPANTPIAMRRKLADEVAVYLKKPETLASFKTSGLVPMASTPEEFGKIITSEIKRWSDVAASIKFEKQ